MYKQLPLVSIIIPAYKHEKYINKTINSVIKQTYKNIELIIIDDNSPDGTWNKIQEMLPKCEKRFVNVIAEKKTNAGISDSLNRGISVARGEYIGILASDDIYKPKLVETLVVFLSKHKEYGLAVGNNEIIDSDGKLCFWDSDRNCVYDKKNAIYKTFVEFLKNERPEINKENFGLYQTFCKGNYIPNGSLIRRKVLDRVLPFPLDIKIEDWYMHLQLSKHCKYKYIDEILFQYRWHENNTIKNRAVIEPNVKILLGHELSIVKHMPEYLETFDKYSGIHKTILQLTKKFRLYKTPCRIVFLIGHKEITFKKRHL